MTPSDANCEDNGRLYTISVKVQTGTRLSQVALFQKGSVRMDDEKNARKRSKVVEEGYQGTTTQH